MAKSRELKVVISGDPSQLNRAFAKAGMGASQLESKVGKASTGIGRSLTTIGKVGSVALAGGLVFGLKESIGAFAEAEKVAAQTTATLKSTGGAANVTAKQIGDLATAISKKSGMDDEAVQSGENLLLTFTNIQNATGKGNDIFNQTVGIMADLSTALGQDTKTSAIQLGKALNDPVKGVTALQRVGVSFTKDQKDQIKTLVESGKTMDAQKLILKELNKEFGGSAEAAGNTFAGKINKAKTAVGNLGEAIGGALAPAIGTAADSLAGFVDKLATSDRPAKFFEGLKGGVDAAKSLFSNLFDDIGKQREGGASLGAAIGTSIADAVGRIRWDSIGKKISSGITGAIHLGSEVAKNLTDAIAAAFDAVNWRAVGDKVSGGLSSGLDFSGKMTSSISAGIGTAVSNVNGRQVLGKLVDVLGEALDALFSPSFWVDHFKGIFSVVTFVIPLGKIFKIPGFGLLYNLISKQIFKAVGLVGEGLLSLFRRVGSRAFTAFLAELEKMAPRTANVLLKVATGGANALKSFPGRVGGWASRAIGAMADKLGDGVGKTVGVMARIVARGVSALGRGVAALAGVAARIVKAILGKFDDLLGNIPSTIVRAISRGVSAMVSGAGRLARGAAQIGKKIVDAIVDAIKSLPGRLSSAIKKGIAGAAGAVGSAISKINPFGDGVGKAVDRLAAPIAPGGGMPNLMGARPAMAPIAAVASKFGLGTSSGLRRGSITSSGNVSYHSTGEALDEAGPPGSMMRFFQYMKSRFGPRLAELIYTPGGVGIKNGRPFRYTGSVAADHYDHVHVAVDTGAPGVGDGSGKTAVDAARRAGFTGSGLVTALAVADAESHFNPGAQNFKYPDHSIGLWQINQLAHHGRYGSDSALKNPTTNAKAAWSISGGGRNWAPWSTFTSGAYKRYLGVARQLVSSASSRSSAPFKVLSSYGQDGTGTHASITGGSGYVPGMASVDSSGVGTAGVDFSGADSSGADMGDGGSASGDVAGPPTWDDIIGAQIAEAALTPGTDDDAKALGWLKWYKGQQLNDARASGDPRAIREAAEAFKSASDAVDQLNGTIDDANKLAQARMELDTQLRDNQLKIIALAGQGPEILAAVVAAVSGGIGGKAGLGFQSVGYAGGVARY